MFSDRSRYRSVRGRQRQRWYWKIIFTGEVQHRSARDQNLKSWAPAEQVGEVRRGVKEMLEVVQHEQENSLAEEPDELLHDRLTAAIAHAERVGNSGEDQGGIAQWRQVNPDHPVREVRRYIVREGLGQTGLADAAGAGQREERNGRINQERPGRRPFTLPADERGAGDGQRAGDHRRSRSGHDLAFRTGSRESRAHGRQCAVFLPQVKA